MITAQEAKALYDWTGAEIQDYLNKVLEKEIVRMAKSGKREYTHHIGAEPYDPPKPTPVQQGVVDELKKLGYTARYGVYGSSYVPRGLADDNGDGPMYQNYGILIRW